MTGDPELARDLTQETFLRAQGAAGRGTGERPLPWLLRVARNLWIDHLRRLGHRPLEAFDDRGELGAHDPAMRRLDEDTGIEAQLRQLPANWQQALILRHMHDLTVEDVARVMGVPEGTVKTWLHRGRARLAGWLVEAEERS